MSRRSRSYLCRRQIRKHLFTMPKPTATGCAGLNVLNSRLILMRHTNGWSQLRYQQIEAREDLRATDSIKAGWNWLWDWSESNSEACLFEADSEALIKTKTSRYLEETTRGRSQLEAAWATRSNFLVTAPRPILIRFKFTETDAELETDSELLIQTH